MTPDEQITAIKKALENIKTYVQWVQSDLKKLKSNDIEDIEQARRRLSLASFNLLSIVQRQNESNGQ